MNGKDGSPLGCRIHISLQGMEWFMYNRTAAFDHIASRLDMDVPITPAPTPVPDGAASVRKIFSRTSVLHDCMSFPIASQVLNLWHYYT